MNKELIICCGISGSGKSTWCSQFIGKNPNYLRISRDDIRRCLVGNLGNYYQRKDLNQVEQIVNDLIPQYISCLYNQYNIIIDNTHLKWSYIKQYLDPGKFLEHETKMIDKEVTDIESEQVN